MEKIFDFNGKSSSRIRLRYIPTRNVFQIHVHKQGAWEGSLKEVWQVMYWDLDVRAREVKLALNEMKKNHHLVADFGISGNFICTFED